MYATQSVLFEGCKLKTRISPENGSALRYISTLSNPIGERIS